jgi:hypothetical protein
MTVCRICNIYSGRHKAVSAGKTTGKSAHSQQKSRQNLQQFSKTCLREPKKRAGEVGWRRVKSSL